jgi:hypothetical protein
VTNEPLTPVVVDPLDPVTGMLFPFVVQRVVEFAREQHPEMNPQYVARQLLAQVVLGNDKVRLTAIVNPQGVIRGHVLASIQSDEDPASPQVWCYIFQAKADANVGDTLRNAVKGLVDHPWLKKHGATHLLMSTGRNEKGWERAFGFRPLRHVMWRPLDGFPTEGEK